MTREQFIDDLTRIGASVAPRLTKHGTTVERITLPNGKVISLVHDTDYVDRVMLESGAFYVRLSKLIGCETHMGNNPLVYEYADDCYISIEW